MSYHVPKWELRTGTNRETGEVFGVVTHVCKKVNSLIVPKGFYSKKRVSNAVGIFYERYIAYLLGGSKTYNPNAQCPDVQLPSDEWLEKWLLFEVKAGHRTNGIVLKKHQLEGFSKLGNCSYAVVFHDVPNIQARWDESQYSRKVIRKELLSPSSVFIVPPHLLLDFYTKHADREQPMPHYIYSEETYVSMKESHMQKAFEEYETGIEKHKDGILHIISNELAPDTSRSEHPFIIRV